MREPSWTALRDVWEQDEGALRDIVVGETTVDDWQHVVDAIRRSRWPWAYTEDDVSLPMPESVAKIFAIRETRTPLWQIAATVTLRINCHFFDVSEIEFSFEPRDVVDQQALESVCSFVRDIGRAARRDVFVYCEAVEPRPVSDMQYDLSLDAVVA